MSAVPKPGMPPLRFAKLEEPQLRQVAAIESRVYAFPWSLGNFRDSLYSGYDCIGAWQGDELIGYAVTMATLEEIHLLNLAVRDDWQGNGAGAAILQHLIDEAAPTKCEVIYLEVRPTNLAALRLYEKFGFRQLGLRRDYYPAVTGREDALFLGLNIKARSVDAVG